MDKRDLLVGTAVVVTLGLLLSACGGSAESVAATTNPNSSALDAPASTMETASPEPISGAGDDVAKHRFFERPDRPDLGPFVTWPPLVTMEDFANEADIVFVALLVDTERDSARAGTGDPFVWIYDGLVFEVQQVLVGEIAAKNEAGQVVVHEPVQTLTPDEPTEELRQRTIRMATIEPFQAGLARLARAESPARYVVFAREHDFTVGGVGYYLFHPDGLIPLGDDGYVVPSTYGLYSDLSDEMGPVNIEQIQRDIVYGRQYAPIPERDRPGPGDPAGGRVLSENGEPLTNYTEEDDR